MISRVRKGKKISFVKNNKLVVDKKILNKINDIKIPPAWENVKISLSSSKILASGKDSRNKTQYIYSKLWTQNANSEKFKRLFEFSKKADYLLKKATGIIKRFDVSYKNFVVSLIIRILFLTCSRVGNETYAIENNTYGISTLLKKHIKIENGIIKFDFVGKKNIRQKIGLKDDVCLNALKLLFRVPGDRVFKTSDGTIIKSSDVNDFILENIGDFTAKDIRTYMSNKLFIDLLKKKPEPICEKDTKKNLLNVYNEVSDLLGNSREICKNSYILPSIGEEYIRNPGLVKRFCLDYFSNKNT